MHVRPESGQKNRQWFTTKMIKKIPDPILQIKTNENGELVYVERTDTDKNSSYKDKWPEWRIVAPTYGGVEVDKTNVEQLAATMDELTRTQFLAEYAAWKKAAQEASGQLFCIYIDNCRGAFGMGLQTMICCADALHYEALARF